MTDSPPNPDYREYVREQIESLTETLTRFMFGDFTVVARTREADEDFGYLCAMINIAINTARNAQGEMRRTNEHLSAEVAERERAEGAIRQSKKLLQAITDNTSAVIYVKDLQGRYLMVNQRFAELFHVSSEAMVGKTDHELFTKDLADAFRAMDQRAAAADRAVTAEEMAPHDDGLHTYVSVKCPLRDEAGRVYGIFGISTDITDRKRIEEALRNSEDQTRSIIDTALDAVVTMNSEGVITGWNAQAEITFGWPRHDALGHLMSDLIVPERYRADHIRGLRRYLAIGESVVLHKRLELSALHRDGHEFPVEFSITPMRSGGRPSFSAFLRDITKRKSDEAKLQAQLERLSLLDQITIAVGERHDLESIYQVTVRSLEERLPADFCCIGLFNAASDVLTITHVGMHSRDLAGEPIMGEKPQISVDSNGLARCSRGELVYEPDIRIVALPFSQGLARGGLRSMVLAPLESEKRVFGILVVARRASKAFSSGECEFLRQLSAHVALAVQQAELRSSLQQAYEDLRLSQQTVVQQERLRALGQMASGIAHDINNAISPVALYTETLLEREVQLSPQGREQLAVIQRAVDDVGQTVSRMREFYDRRETQSQLATVDMNRCVEQIANLTRARWRDLPQKRGIVITLREDLAPSLPQIMGAESEVRDSLTNLVFNAVDAMPDGGVLTIRTQGLCRGAHGPEQMSHVSVEVSDTGIGMDEDTKARCVEPFFTTKGERGTGLGLAMVFGMAKRNGAELDIDSALGSGTTVRLTFPVAATQDASTHPANQIGLRRPLRMLIVDDDPLLLQALRDTLRSDGHMVTAADGGQAGIDAFRAAEERGESFEVVITDLGMPYVDGNKVAAAINSTAPETPVILLTGWGQQLLSAEDIPAEVDRVLAKPPKLDDLRRALAELTAARSESAPER